MRTKWGTTIWEGFSYSTVVELEQPEWEEQTWLKTQDMFSSFHVHLICRCTKATKANKKRGKKWEDTAGRPAARKTPAKCGSLRNQIKLHLVGLATCAMVKSRVLLGMENLPALMTEIRHPLLLGWVSHPLWPYGNNGSWSTDPGTIAHQVTISIGSMDTNPIVSPAAKAAPTTHSSAIKHAL